MDQETIRRVLNGRGIQVTDEHLAMLEAQTNAMEAMRAALEEAPPPDADIGVIHALQEPAHD